MTGTAVVEEAGPIDKAAVHRRATLPVLVSLVAFSAWCGLVAGLLEVAAIVIRKEVIGPDHLYRISRHFIWLIPLINVGVFAVVGLLVQIADWLRPDLGRWIGVRLLCALSLSPVLMTALPRLYSFACFVLALGASAPLVRFCERHARGAQHLFRVSIPVLLALFLVLAALPWAGDWVKQAKENRREMPASGSPNVLLIVLDTVAAGHLSLNGYERDTSNTLVELASRGIQFEQAQASSSWTLPSHATMFTGRPLHELSVGWLHPLDDAFPTLAEYLGAGGYATAGFVANVGYCAADSGLGRGFTRYRDYIFPRLTAFKLAVLVERTLKRVQFLSVFLDRRQDFIRAQPYVDRLLTNFLFDRKEAKVVNRELLGWLSSRPQPERPFFAFLNYGDAHSPYHLPPGRLPRFGEARTKEGLYEFIEGWHVLPKTDLPPQAIRVAVDAYDDCVADLDEQLGVLLDELQRRGVLDRTWLFITADHGESFGEHAGIFSHGTSLYQTELHVPLLIVPPGGRAAKRAVKETVSLRDLATTIAEVVCLGSSSPFPGESLARFWDDRLSTGRATNATVEPAMAEVLVNDPLDCDQYGLPNKTWPMAALKTDEWSYIRREHDASEHLFHIRVDAKEERNLAGAPAAQPVLGQLREALRRQAGGPLLPDQFNR
jgi:arylsulfatase A-like enzyme